METKDLEWFKKNLQVVIDGKDSKISELEAKLKSLQSENRILKSYIDYLGCQNKELRIKNENLESDVMDYKQRIGLFD